jgi:predicted negative regulator of RcsB-dependent stress response
MLALAACSGGGSTSTATTVTTGLGISTTTVPKFSGSASSKYCSVARQFSQVAQANLASDPKTLFQEFDTLASQYLAVVPAVIKADANTLVSAIEQLETAVKAVNYDLTKISPAALAPVQAPMFTAAANRIDAYDSQVCGLTTTST